MLVIYLCHLHIAVVTLLTESSDQLVLTLCSSSYAFFGMNYEHNPNNLISNIVIRLHMKPFIYMVQTHYVVQGKKR